MCSCVHALVAMPGPALRLSTARSPPLSCAPLRGAFDFRRVGRAVVELGALGPIALFTVVGPAIGALVLVATAPAWLDPLRALGWSAVPLVVVLTVVLAGFSLVPTHASSAVAGVLFGAAAGSVVAMAGIVGAALLGYAVLRRWIGRRTIAGLARRPRAAAVHRALVHAGARRTAGLIVLVRLSPVMPFAATNLLMAASGVGLGPFLAGSLAGLAPRVIAVAVAGAGLAELDLARSADVRLAIAGALATVAVLVVMGRIARAALREVA